MWRISMLIRDVPSRVIATWVTKKEGCGLLVHDMLSRVIEIEMPEKKIYLVRNPVFLAERAEGQSASTIRAGNPL